MRIRFLVLLCWLPAVVSAEPLVITPPGTNATVTTFASGLSFPTGLVQRADGAILVGTTAPNGAPGSFVPYYEGSGSVLAFRDLNNDGLADGPGTVVAGPFTGAVTGLALAGDTLIVGTTGNGGVSPNGTDILFLRPSGDTYTQVNSIHFEHAGGDNNPAFTVVPTGPQQYDLYFQVSATPYGPDPLAPATVTGLVGGAAGTTLPGASLYRVAITDTGATISAGAVQQVASGVRNSFGMIALPSGDIIFSDNGAEGDTFLPLSADELNRIAAGATGLDFGYYASYVDPVTGSVVGSSTPPFAAFTGPDRPRGIANIALTPAGFPASFANGLFIGFHGNFFESGASNLFNPVLFYDFTSNTYRTFIPAGQPGVGNLDSLLATGNALFLADFSAGGVFEPNSGILYRVVLAADTPASVPEPATLSLMMLGLSAAAIRRRRSAR